MPDQLDPPTDDLVLAARRVRGTVLELSHKGHAPHLGSSLSCVDILVACYWRVLNVDAARPADPDRDRFILSKGHAAQALYATLAHRGFFPFAALDEYNADGGRLPEHPPANVLPGVEAATGSLGHGLPIALGLALGARLSGRDYRVIALLSDGECNEGSVWEAALLAAGQGVGNLTAIVDYNKWQATGRSDEITGLAPLADKWTAFGWRATEVDGHDPDAIARLLRAPSDGRPAAIVAHTVKGKGVSFMEDDNNWHYRVPTADELAAAKKELGLA